jgi:hypothetical protein
MRGATPASRLALIRGLDLPNSYVGRHFFDAQIGHLFDGPRLRKRRVSIMSRNLPVVQSRKRQCCCLDSRNLPVLNVLGEVSGDVKGASYGSEAEASK